MISGFLPLILLYPETHYRFRYFSFSKYFKKEPEIIIDMPYKSLTGKFPVFLIIKDSDLFPVLVWEIRFSFLFEDGSTYVKTNLMEKEYNSGLDFEVFNFDFSEKHGFVNLRAEIFYYAGQKRHSAVNDNLKDITTELEIFINDDEEFFDNYLQGDLHFHSQYTSDQVEFGAPAEAAKLCAECLGLNFFALTDHSYDLDDEPENYLKQDPELKKFEEMRSVCDELTDENIIVLPGEEITVRNGKNRNVHLLVYDENFFYGSGDGAENWLNTKSENSISDIVSNTGENSLVIAAHPFNKTPPLEYLLVRRGLWSTEDVLDNSITHLQILNGDFDENFFKSLMIWVQMLLKGHRIFITAGNDAHGNFNIFRQVKIPMLKLTTEHKQIFGKCRTAVYSESTDKISLLKSIRSGNMYITNGPHIMFTVNDGGKTHETGSSFKPESDNLEAEFFVNSSTYSGPVKGVVVYRGSINAFDEKIIYEKQLVESLYSFSDKIDMVNDKIDHYLRIEVFTSAVHGNGKHYEHRAYSNPIWIVK